ncbi:MAG TPA: hypothetical protein VGS12_04800 [Caulobacteraceae bacterium]|nr:hypothetical protein [Caulobacteraceae bacterium]
MPRLKRVAPFLLAGPVTGPLLAGAFFNYREGRPVLASLYFVAAVETTILIPLITAHLGWRLIA